MSDPGRNTVLYFRGGAPAWVGAEQARPAGADRLQPGEAVRVDVQPTLTELAELAAVGHPLVTRESKRLGAAVVELTGRLEVALGAARQAAKRAARDDDDTVVIDPELAPELIARAIVARREIGLEHDPLVALADMADRLLGYRHEAAIIVEAGGQLPRALIRQIADAQRSLGRAVSK